MNKKTYTSLRLRKLGRLGQWLMLVFGILALGLLVLAFLLLRALNKTNANVEIEQGIGITPTQVEAMKQIGEWEFLSIANEEMVDTVRQGFFSDDELIRIYQGTLRLGINMHKAKPHFIRQEKDSIVVTLPPIELLDENFIDETRTESFFESGDWNDQAREEMYMRAVARMKQRCLNSSNLRSA